MDTENLIVTELRRLNAEHRSAIQPAMRNLVQELRQAMNRKLAAEMGTTFLVTDRWQRRVVPSLLAIKQFDALYFSRSKSKS